MTSNVLHHCEVCNSPVPCYTESIGRGGRYKPSRNLMDRTKMFTKLVSDDGVYFAGTNTGGIWFCNDCWALLLKGVTQQPKDI